MLAIDCVSTTVGIPAGYPVASAWARLAVEETDQDELPRPGRQITHLVPMSYLADLLYSLR